MKTLFPAASACLVVAFVASVGYAESQLEAAAKSTEAAPIADSSRPELSVAPLQYVTYPDDRPSWIQREPDLDSAVHTWVVTTSGCESIEQCEAELVVFKRAAVALYIKETTGWVCDDDFLDDRWIEDQLVARRYVGTLVKGDDRLNEIAVELEFDAESRQRIQRAQKDCIVNDRLRATGGLFALALIGLCCTGGLLGALSRRFA
jgi:hypothetical protein